MEHAKKGSTEKMPKSDAPSSPTALLDRLNQTFDEAEREVANWTQVRDAIKNTRDTLVKTMLSGNSSNASRTRTQRTHKSRRSGNATLTQVMLTALENAPEPVTVAELLSELKKHGIKANEPSVRSTLSGCKKRGLVQNPSYGKWTTIATTSQKAA